MVYLHGNRQSGYTKHKEYAMLSLPLVRDKGGHVSIQRCGKDYTSWEVAGDTCSDVLLPSQLRATGPELLPGTTAGGPRWGWGGG